MPTVLVVEDDPGLLYAITRYLTKLDLFVIAMPNSMEALAVLETEVGATVDVLLVDIVMPSGMPHGISLATMAKLKLAGLSIVYMTAYRNVTEVLGRPLDHPLFTKPLDLEALGKEVLRLASWEPPTD